MGVGENYTRAAAMVIVIRSSHLEIHVFRYDWLVEQGGLETSVSRETFAKENLASIGEITG